MRRDGVKELQDYLGSYGSVLPGDAKRFSFGMDYADQCVFCGEAHSENVVYQYDLINESRSALDCYSCDICDDIISSEIVQMHFPQYSRHRSAPTEHTKHPNAKHNIQQYVLTGRFPAGHERYYRYLMVERDTYVGQRPYHCVFCDVHTGIKNVVTLEVPQDTNSQLDGGLVNVCDECYDELTTGFHDSGNTLDDITLTRECSVCKQHHKVYTREMQQRDKHDSRVTPYYMCPFCTYAKIQNNTVIAFDSPLNHSPRQSSMEIYHWQKCKTCKKDILLDLRIDHGILSKLYLHNGNVYCEQCNNVRFLTGRAHEATKYVAHLAGELYLSVVKESKWRYILTKVSGIEAKEVQEIYRSVAEYNSITEAIMIGGEEGLKLQHTKQYPIW